MGPRDPEPSDDAAEAASDEQPRGQPAQGLFSVCPADPSRPSMASVGGRPARVGHRRR